MRENADVAEQIEAELKSASTKTFVKPFSRRDVDGAEEWFCVVNGEEYGPWRHKGGATEGYEARLRRCIRGKETA